jgi:hypothetical protein
MKISGFSCVRNAQKLFYPVVESIRSILPVCDEFIIAVGEGDPDDQTRKMILDIGSSKIKIIDTDWNQKEYIAGDMFRKQTDIALSQCTGDWCFYLQADEVIHEKYLPTIVQKCEKYLNLRDVFGLLFNYKHFWADFDHYHISHAWYPREIRIVRNNCGIGSWRDAQSFRCNAKKIPVALAEADVYHYGWARPPSVMQVKRKEFKKFYGENLQEISRSYDYGSLEGVPVFTGTHPEVMKEWVAKINWKDQLQYSGKSKTLQKHAKPKYRILTFLEQRLLGGKQIGGFKNYKLVK